MSNNGTHMNIDYNTFPFPHVVVDGAITMDASNVISGYANSIAESTISFKRGGEQQDNMAMHNNSQGIDGVCFKYHMDVYSAMERVSRLFDEHDSENYNWSHCLTETNRNHGNFLHPHTDDPEIIKQRQMERKEISPEPSILKALLYVAESRKQYSHYGTKIYMDADRSSFVKEIEFVPCRLFMWKTQHNSWHGTDFIHGLPDRRIFYTGEYLKIEAGKTPGPPAGT